MNKSTIIELLKEYDKNKVEVFVTYCERLISEKKDGQFKNPWMSQRNDKYLADCFKAVASDGMDFDGKHITLQNTGVSYDYVAYKNKMLLVYPESLIDVGMVYTDDSFSFKKESGRVIYTHEIKNPFGNREENIVGGYCVIKNKRGEFITLLSVEDINKHRKVAKTDYIWKNWFYEMCMKTIIKKACTQHFRDTFSAIETLDNDNYDIEQPLGISIDTKAEIEEINVVDDLTKYYKANASKNAGVMEDFVKALANRKEQLLEEAENGNN